VNLLIVESPGKIKKLRKILGSGWNIKASMGHFRELANDGEDNLGFDLCDQSIKMRFKPKDSKSSKFVSELKTSVKQASQVYIASDPDREGEVIAWHLYQSIPRSESRKIRRVTFAEITDKAVKAAIANPRSLDQNLVDSGLARSCLDKLVGFRASPLVWNLGAKSVGRVQSAVLHLVCRRAKEIEDFVPRDYYLVYSDYLEGFRAYYLPNGLKENNSRGSQDSEDSAAKSNNSHRLFDEPEARRIVSLAQNNAHRIIKIERKSISKKPPAPFTTSTLQQASSSKLNLSPEKTMKLAQTLYEKGLITYMRTDSVNLSADFCEAARKWLQTKDPQNVPTKTSKFQSKKGAQEAHEAIRPSDLTYPSTKLKEEISPEEFNLYLTIWKRAIASQCAPAKIAKTKVLIEVRDTYWLAKGQTTEFKGYARYWPDLSDDVSLPLLKEGQQLSLKKCDIEKKRTSPPSNYTEAKLVALMEKKGIGRPSTYSSSIKTLKSRSYVKLTKKKLVPTDLGKTVDSFLDKPFKNLIDEKFTAQMESSLDAIASGDINWENYLCGWNNSYFAPALSQAHILCPEAKPRAERKPAVLTEHPCPVCGKQLEEYTYTKDKQEKKLLRCSDLSAREKSNHKQAVYFMTKNGSWWSKKFGTIGEEDNGNNPNRQPAVLTKYPCPICGKQLEKYSYTKDGQEKKLLRCSDPKAREKSNHKQAVYFMTKNGDWWSKKFGILDI